MQQKCMQQKWWVYMLECEGGYLYTGITTNPQRRFVMHREGRGARFTRMHRPLQMVAVMIFENRVEASREEHRLKQLSRTEKWLWVKAHPCPNGLSCSVDS